MRRLSPLLALAGLLLAATAWSAPRIPVVAPPAVARPGAEYETPLPALPAGVEEFELFLVPDDGSGRAIRLTAEHEAGGGPLRWRMPRLAAARARLVLRAGGRFGETESAPSAAFAIEAPAAPARDRVLRGEDELAWHFGDEDAPSPAALLPPGTATIAEGRARVVAIEPTREGGPQAPAPAAFTASASTHGRTTTPGAPTRSRRPAFVPLRN